MRTWIPILIAGCVGFTLAYVFVSLAKDARFARERRALRTDLEAAQVMAGLPVAAPTAHARSSRASAAKAELGNPTVPAGEILERLKKIRVGSGEKRSEGMRQVIHQLENLVDLGPAAIPVMREFLARFEDVEYGLDTGREEPFDSSGAARAWQAFRGASALPGTRPARFDFTSPPSLRLGLIGALKEINGEAAEQAIAEVLSTTGRAVEVAYATRLLQEMAPDKYREMAIGAARDLLTNLPKIDHPNRLDENAKSYLYSVFDLFGDTSFAASAQGLLVNADGHVDRTALGFITASLKDQAVSALYRAYRDPRVTNVSERAALASQILAHAGANAEANNIFKEMVTDENMAPWMRAMTIQSLAGGRGPFATAMPTEPAQVQARIDLLNTLPELRDESMAQARNEALERLGNRLATLTDATDAASASFRARAERSVPPGASDSAPTP